MTDLACSHLLHPVLTISPEAASNIRRPTNLPCIAQKRTLSRHQPNLIAKMYTPMRKIAVQVAEIFLHSGLVLRN